MWWWKVGESDAAGPANWKRSLLLPLHKDGYNEEVEIIGRLP